VVGKRTAEEAPSQPSTIPAMSSIDSQEAACSRWHSNDWEAVLSGKGTADRYFMRSGLIRKDRLAKFAPREHHPTTVALRSFEELCTALHEFGSDAAGADDVRFVLKRAHSSNAKDMRFLTGADTVALLRSQSSMPTRSGVLLGCTATIVIATMTIATATRRTRESVDMLALNRWTAALAAFSVVAASTTAWAATQAVSTDRAALPIAGADGGQRHLFASRHRSELVEELQRILTPALLAKPSDDRAAKPAVWILQRHVDPWLCNGRKFHLRALLLCVGDLKAYVHKNVRMLLATELFERGRCDGALVAAHVTNMSAGAQQPGYDAAAQNRPLADLGAETARRVLDEAVEVLGVTLTQVRRAGRRQFFTLPNCWELFGADFLMEAGSGRVVLLELNPSPSLAMYGAGETLEVRAGLLGGVSDPLQSECLLPPAWLPVPLMCVGMDSPVDGD